MLSNLSVIILALGSSVGNLHWFLLWWVFSCHFQNNRWEQLIQHRISRLSKWPRAQKPTANSRRFTCTFDHWHKDRPTCPTGVTLTQCSLLTLSWPKVRSRIQSLNAHLNEMVIPSISSRRNSTPSWPCNRIKRKRMLFFLKAHAHKGRGYLWASYWAEISTFYFQK